MNTINVNILILEVRKSVFGNRISQSQINGIKRLVSVWEKEYAGVHPIEFLAYCMATSYWECKGKMMPVREDRAKEGTALRKVQDRYWLTGYYARGDVGLTWEKNYRKAGKRFGVDLVNNPDKALDPELSARVLFTGTIEGWFGKPLTALIHADPGPNNDYQDFVNARAAVNGKDKNTVIASYAVMFESALYKAMKSTSDVVEEPEADGKSIITSKTAQSASILGTLPLLQQLTETSNSIAGMDWKLVIALAAICLAGFIIWDRWRKSHEDGV